MRVRALACSVWIRYNEVMDVAMLIDAVVRQTTVMIAQLATTGGNRAHLAHTANQVFLDLVGALREQGLGSKVIADMFGMALRTYHQRVQRLGESRTERGRTLWEAVFDYLQQNGPVTRAEVLRRFARDDEVVLRSLLKDLVGSGVVYRTGRGDHVRYHVAETHLSNDTSEQSLADLICLAVHRAAPATVGDVAATLSVESERLTPLMDKLVTQGRLRIIQQTQATELRYTSMGCVIPLGEPQGWEIAVFDHYQAMVTAICTKLRQGRQRAVPGDQIGGSTFSYTVWPSHPHYEEATQFLARFRREGAALRAKIAAYNQAHDATPGAEPSSATPSGTDAKTEHMSDDRVKVIVYAGQTVQVVDVSVAASAHSSDDDLEDGDDE